MLEFTSNGRRVWVPIQMVGVIEETSPGSPNCVIHLFGGKEFKCDQSPEVILNMVLQAREFFRNENQIKSVSEIMKASLEDEE